MLDGKYKAEVGCSSAAGGLVGISFGTGAIVGGFGGMVNGTVVDASNLNTWPSASP